MPQKKDKRCQVCGIATYRDRCFQHRVATHRGPLRQQPPRDTGPSWWLNLDREQFNEQIAKRVHQREQQMGTNYATPEYS